MRSPSKTLPLTTRLPERGDVDPAMTWDLTSIFRSLNEWEAAFRQVEESLPILGAFCGTLGASAARLLEWIRAVETCEPLLQSVDIYAAHSLAVDRGNALYTSLAERATALVARYREATAFAIPELLAMDAGQLERFLADEPALQEYRHYFDNRQRHKPHTRTPEVEELLASAATVLDVPRTVWAVLADSEITFDDALAVDGTAVPVARTTFKEVLASGDRSLRESAYRSHTDAFLRVRKSLGAIVAGKIRGAVFLAKARGFGSALEMSLFESNVPVGVYRNVIDAFRRHLPLWHRYWEVRRKLLKLAPGKLAPWDIFAPLGEEEISVPYAQSVEWISKGMAPLGGEYVEQLAFGATEGRWVDSACNKGKRAGAWSGGGYRTPPYILMSYKENLFGMSTLAHELGHSMHSLYSRKEQPFLLYRYTLFAAEVASNFNQAMVRDYLLQQNLGRGFKLAMLEEAMGNFHRYLFLMPLLAQFEEFAHETMEREGALTEPQMTEYLGSLFAEAYGPAMEVHAEAEGIQWAQYAQMFSSFYVYQYASGIAGANALARKVLTGGPSEVENYLGFLKAGGSKYPIEALMAAGVDMTKSETMDAGFRVLEGYITQLEELLP